MIKLYSLNIRYTPLIGLEKNRLLLENLYYLRLSVGEIGLSCNSLILNRYFIVGLGGLNLIIYSTDIFFMSVDHY